MRFTTATPYIAVFVILRQADKVAFILRSNTGWMDGNYTLPAGRVEKNEAYSAAAIRESQEEVGAEIAPANLRPLLTMHRKDDDSEWVDVYFEAQSWQGELYNAEPEKHGELVWLDLANLPENIVPVVRAALTAIEAGKTYTEFNWD